MIGLQLKSWLLGILKKICDLEQVSHISRFEYGNMVLGQSGKTKRYF